VTSGSNPLFLPPSLPDGTYVVATTRPGNEYRLSAARVRTLALDGRAESNRQDALAYIQAHAQREGVRRWLTERSLGQAEFTETLLQRSEGNFLYLHHVLQAIESGEFQGFDQEDLPHGLRDHYRRHWETMRARDRHLFDGIYRPVVCVLGATREPVSQEQIAEWTGLEHHHVQRVIRDWRQFLYEERGKDRLPLYRLYHMTFQEFLQEEVDLGLKTYHAMIACSVLNKVRMWKSKHS
jgi:hypothetical protein